MSTKQEKSLPVEEKSLIQRIIDGELGADEALQGVSFADSSEGSNAQRTRKRKLTKKQRRRLVVARLALLGYSTKVIARELGVKPSTVLKDIRDLHEEWKARIADSIDILKQRELARIDILEREYWNAWYRSIEAEVKALEVKEGDSGKRSTRRSVKKWAVGKVEFLQGVQWCIERRIEILGLKAPEKIDSRHLVYAEFTHPEELVDKVSDDILVGIARIIASGGGNGSRRLTAEAGE